MPPRSKLTVSASAWRETPYEDCFLCQTLYRDDHIMRFCNDESTEAMTLEERLGPQTRTQ